MIQMGSLGGMMGGGPSAGGMDRPGSLLNRVRAAQAAQPFVPTPTGAYVQTRMGGNSDEGVWYEPVWDPNAGPMTTNPNAAAPAAPAGVSPMIQAAVQRAAAAAQPPILTDTTPAPAVIIGSLGETAGAGATTSGATASTAPTSSRRRRRAPNQGRAATLLGGGETAEVLGV